MTFDLDTWHTNSTWHYLGQIQRSRSWINLVGHKRKRSFFGYGCALRREVFFGCLSRVVCAELVGATSSDGFLVSPATTARLWMDGDNIFQRFSDSEPYTAQDNTLGSLIIICYSCQFYFVLEVKLGLCDSLALDCMRSTMASCCRRVYAF